MTVSLSISQPLFAQAKYNFGDTYATVLANLLEFDAQVKVDKLPLHIAIYEFDKKDKIKEIWLPNLDREKVSITYYYFNTYTNELIKKVNINYAGNADRMLAWTIDVQTEHLGKPTIVQDDGKTKYCWDREVGKYCYFKDLSESFKWQECVFSVHTPNN